jgi:hypothetical protein
MVRGDNGILLKWSRRRGRSSVRAGLITAEELRQTLAHMQTPADDDFLVLAPRMSIVWARKE